MFEELITLLCHDRGAVVVEFAITASLLVLLLLGVGDYGKLMNTSAMLLGASRAGAEYVAANWNNLQVDTTTGAKKQVCGFFGPGVGLSGGSCSPLTPVVTPIISTRCTCAGTATAVSCPGPNDPSPCPDRVLLYIGVTASEPFTPVFIVRKFPLLSGLVNLVFPPNQSTNGGTLTPTTWVRVQ
jgi:hypothetical protein